MNFRNRGNLWVKFSFEDVSNREIDNTLPNNQQVETCSTWRNFLLRSTPLNSDTSERKIRMSGMRRGEHLNRVRARFFNGLSFFYKTLVNPNITFQQTSVAEVKFYRNLAITRSQSILSKRKSQYSREFARLSNWYLRVLRCGHLFLTFLKVYSRGFI